MSERTARLYSTIGTPTPRRTLRRAAWRASDPVRHPATDDSMEPRIEDRSGVPRGYSTLALESPHLLVRADCDGVPESGSRSKGLWRTALGNPRQTLPEAFADLERSSQLDRVVRHVPRDLVSARLTLTPGEGSGYWEFTRIRDDFYVILMNLQ